MNGVNNQSIHPIVTQNLEFFQEPTKSANEDEVDAAHLLVHFQEMQGLNAAKSSNHQPIQKRGYKKWTKEESKRFLELKQQQPKLPWKEFAKQYFPDRTDEQCRDLWRRLALSLEEKKRIVNSGITQDLSIDNLYERIQKRELEGWSEEENKQFIALKQQQPELSWQDLAQYFPRKTSEQCNSHWHKVLAPRLYEELNLSLHQKTKRIDPIAESKQWTREENKQFIELKQQHPEMPWKDFAGHFPEHTTEQCRAHWHKVLASRLYREEKLIDQKAEQIDPTAESKRWTQEENKRFIELKQQHPEMPWKDFAEHFPGHTDEQCRDHWSKSLSRKLIRKRKLTGEENNDNHLSKRLRIELPSPPIPAIFGGENRHPFMNSSPIIPQELAGIAVPNLSHALPIQKTPRDEQKNLLDLSFYHYETAVNHFHEIQLTNPLLQSVQQKAAQCLANIRIRYQVIQQRLTIEENFVPILEQAKPLINLFKTSTYYFETIYQHFLSYQATQESKDWFFSQSQEFAHLYFTFLTGKIDEVKFRHLIFLKKRGYLIFLKERNYCHQKLNNLSIRLQHVLKKHSSSLNLLEEYNKFIKELFSNIEFQLNLLVTDDQQNWKSLVSSLEETLSRLQEIEIFFESFFDPIPPIETEANIIARLKNEISLQDFYAKQTALMPVQKEGKQAEDFVPLHEPSQTPSQIQEDFLSNPLFSPLSDQEY